MVIYMNIRTDLITEIKAEKEPELFGIETAEEKINKITISTVKVTNNSAAQILGKPIGTYCTVSFPRLDFVCDTQDVINATVKSLKKVCDTNPKATLVAGLGNTDITPDALGPFACDRVLATRHLSDTLKHSL